MDASATRAAASPDEPLEGTFLIEASGLEPPADAASVTEHSFGDLGTVAVSVAVNGRLNHYYPLIPEGLNDLHRAIRDAGLTGGGVAFPGTIAYSERQRGLQVESLSD